MTKPIIREHDIETDTIIDREMTDEEIKQKAEVDAFDAERAQQKAAADEARQAVLDKLGLSADEVAALLG